MTGLIREATMRTRRELLKFCLAAASAILPSVIVTRARAEQTSMSTMMINLIDALRSTGKDVCIAAALELEATEGAKPEISIHLRNAGLDVFDARILASALSMFPHQGGQRIRSFSVSYNPLLGDDGTVALAKSLPVNISEIGFVGCKIGSEGGDALLKWANQSTSLNMICVEENSFTSRIKAEFRKLKDERPGLLAFV